VEAEYRIVNDVILMILTDVTRRRQLENEILNERNRLNFVVSTVRETNDFLAILHEFNSFCKEGIQSLLNQLDRSGTKDPAKPLDEAYRCIHTFKGLFAQQSFLSLPKALHKAESQLARMKKDPGQYVPQFKSFLEGFDLYAFLKKDLAIIEEFLGPDFLKQDSVIVISKKQIDRIEEMASKLLQTALDDLADNQILELIQRIREIRQLTFKSLLSSYPGYTLDLAGRLGKKIKNFEINGEDIMVNPDRFMPFARTLVHVFRNAVDHGIESPEQRLDNGKDEKGNIRCHVSSKEGHLYLTVADDGQGIDAAKLRKKAVDVGLYTARKAETTPDREIQLLIFAMDFSTKDDVTDLSGRGVGLSAVYAEIKKLGGHIEIESTPGHGCSIRFSIPLRA
jgi:two-component system chemotaxis sensor kinase CheA